MRKALNEYKSEKSCGEICWDGFLEKDKIFGKGQGAIEFLMTYGWAIFVILIVLGSLIFYFSQLRSFGEFCFAEQGFTCNDAIATVGSNDNVNVSLRFGNQRDKAITVINATCVKGEITEHAQKTIINKQINPGGTEVIRNIQCYEDGNLLKAKENQDILINVFIWYNLTNDIVPYRVTKVSIKTKTQRI